MIKTFQTCQLFFLASLFALPGLLAYGVYTHPDAFPMKNSPQGTWLTPIAQRLPLMPADKWQLVLWEEHDCSARCEQKLDELARIRLALGRKLYDVDVVLLLGYQAKPLTPAFKKQLADIDLRWQQLTKYEQEQWESYQPIPNIFLADRQQLAILSYDFHQKPNAIFNDLKKML